MSMKKLLEVIFNMFSKIKRVLDDYEEIFKKSYSINTIPNDQEFIEQLTLASYDEVNVYWLSRGLKVLSDEDVPIEMRRSIIKNLRKKYNIKEN